ncbi:MBL fold metallo-hydrolase [Spirochaetia bacterium]|nr:MBL fold metallo-hydrolase [Spirochaetia bacterium]
MRLLKDLYVLTGPGFGLLSYVYGIKYSGGLVLIDAGMIGQSEKQIDKWRRYWGLEKEKVTHVLLTHSHWDHVGCAAAYRKEGTLIAAHEGDQKNIEAGGPLPEDPDQNAWPPCKIDLVLKGDGELPIGELDLKVIHIPGHTPGSVIYRLNMEGKDIWFVGDFIKPDGFGAQHEMGWCGDERFSPRDLLASARKLWKLRPDGVLGGHGIKMDNCEGLPREFYNNLLLALPCRG